MVEVGIRELKAKLSYYVQLMQAGETVGIKVRDRVVGFLSKLKPTSFRGMGKHPKRQDIDKVIERWKREGFLLSGGPYRHRSVKKIRMKGDLTASALIRKLRDEAQ